MEQTNSQRTTSPRAPKGRLVLTSGNHEPWAPFKGLWTFALTLVIMGLFLVYKVASWRREATIEIASSWVCFAFGNSITIVGMALLVVWWLLGDAVLQRTV